MDNGMVSYEQGIYYPVTSVDGNYGYIYAGTDVLNEWDQQQKLVGLDGQNIQYSGMQNENFPYVYYTSGYDYAQSPYNPYNPYIPGAVIGTDAQYVGTQYMQTVPQPSYGPVMHQSIPDIGPTSYSDAFYFNNNVNYTSALPSMSVTTTPLKASYGNLSLEATHPANQNLTPGWYSEGVGDNTASRTKFVPYVDMTSGCATQMIQMANHSSQGGVLSETKPLKATSAATYAFTNEGTRQGFQSSRPQNKSTSELNMGPRTNKPKTQLKSPISLKAFTSKAGNIGSGGGTIVLNPDDYNKGEFSVDYPDAKFFIIKSYSEDDVHKSIKYSVWSSTISGNKKLNSAYEEAQKSAKKCPVFLFFSVNASGHFCGVAEMIGAVDFEKDMDFWLQDKWSGCFPVKWHIIKDVTNSSFRHIILVNNECRPVTSSRDTQDVPYLPGVNMLTIFKNTPLKTWVLDDFFYYEERQRVMHEEKCMLRQFYQVSIGGATASNVEELHVKPRNGNKQAKKTNVEDDADVLTVGSVQINITDTNRLISGGLTIGSFPSAPNT